LPENAAYAGKRRVLDFGCGNRELAVECVARGHRVVAVDLEPRPALESEPSLCFWRGDLRRCPDSWRASFDLALAVSTLEHCGLAGRYGVEASELGADLACSVKLRYLLKPDGRALVTVPVGADAVFPPWHRVYGRRRLPRLLDGWDVEESAFFVKRTERAPGQPDVWRHCSEDEALDSESAAWGGPERGRFLYALGCFVLCRRR
jgi:SAM-dependent methyltransferase